MSGLEILGGFLVLVSAFLTARSRTPSAHPGIEKSGSMLLASLSFAGGLVILATSYVSHTLEQDYRALTVDLITGGDSFIYLGFEQWSNGETVFPIHHRGQYPVYDLIIEIENIQTLLGVGSREIADLSLARQRSEYAVYTGRRTRNIFNRFLPDGIERTEYVISISSRNRDLTQILQIRRIGDSWARILRVFDADQGYALILEDVDSNYPRNSAGEIPWLTFEHEGNELIKWIAPSYD